MNRRTIGVIVAAFIAQGIAIGSTIASFTLFLRPVAESFDASTLEVSIGVSLMTLSLAACGVPIGIWLDRGSPKKVMFTGCTIMTTALGLASQAQSLGMLAVLCVLAGIGIPMLGPLTTAAVVGKVATEQRGRALGIANLGLPVFGIGFALTAGFAIEAWGWRATLQLFSAIIFVFGFPAIAFGIPIDLGADLRMQADSSGGGETWTPKHLLASPNFRMIALILGIGMGITTGWTAHVAPFLIDLKASMRFAGGMLGGMQGAMMIGTFVLGAMADRHSPVRILLGVFAVQTACFALLFADLGLSVASAMLLVSGVASGGLLPVMSHLFANKFGSGNLGRSMGLANLAILPFGFGLPMIAGGLRDATGSYSTTILLCLCLLLVGIAAIASLARLERIEQPTAL
jgi:predicted MFS family arabinose efflux permease